MDHSTIIKLLLQHKISDRNKYIQAMQSPSRLIVMDYKEDMILPTTTSVTLVNKSVCIYFPGKSIGWEKTIYNDTRKLFDVLTVTDKDYE